MNKQDVLNSNAKVRFFMAFVYMKEGAGFVLTVTSSSLFSWPHNLCEETYQAEREKETGEKYSHDIVRQDTHILLLWISVSYFQLHVVKRIWIDMSMILCTDLWSCKATYCSMEIANHTVDMLFLVFRKLCNHAFHKLFCWINPSMGF